MEMFLKSEIVLIKKKKMRRALLGKLNSAIEEVLAWTISR